MQHYFILAVSKNKAQLYEVTGDRILPRGVDGMPISMSDAWNGLERQEKSLQFHSGGASGSNAVFHGQGGAKDVEEQEEDRYMHALAKSVHPVLHGQHAPLVFAGVTEEYGMFKKFDKSGSLLDDYIRGNPDQIIMEDLKAKADPIVHEHLQKENEALIEQYGNLLGTGRTSHEAAAIIEAAKNGKVDVLLVSEGSETHAAQAMTHTMRHRGRVVMVEAGKLPEGAVVAAILRF